MELSSSRRGLSLPTTGLAGSPIARRQIDYWVTVGDKPAAILSHDADATGTHTRATVLRRKRLLAEQLATGPRRSSWRVAGSTVAEGVPLAVIVSDFFHWEYLGDWSFHSGEWPRSGCNGEPSSSPWAPTLIVSVWPFC